MSEMPLHPEVQENRHNWGWFLALGILQLVLGIFAIIASGLATVSLMFVLGWLFLISGGAAIIESFFTAKWSGFFLLLLGGVLDIVLGVLFVTRPVGAALTLTLLLAAFLMVGGAFHLVSALTWHMPHWGWEALSGGIALVLGILLWSRWPTDALWFIGFAVGVDLLFRGWSWIMLAAALRSGTWQAFWADRRAWIPHRPATP